MPLIGQDMADEYPQIVGITIVRGTFTTWTDLHRTVFRANPRSDLVPQLMGANKDREDLYERWTQWHNDALKEARISDPQIDEAGLERIVKWGGVTPFRVTDTACTQCASPRSVIAVVSPMCWPEQPADGDTRQPWTYNFPAEHLRTEIASSHDRHWERHNEFTQKLFNDMKEDSYTDDQCEAMGLPPMSGMSLSDLYEAGYEDEVSQLEEQASEWVAEVAADLHHDLLHIPLRVRTDWEMLLARQVKSRLGRTHGTSREVTRSTWEGLRRWQEATGH
jgi:hypothetical protein